MNHAVDSGISLVSPTGANVGKKYLNGTVVVEGGEFDAEMVSDITSAPEKSSGANLVWALIAVDVS